MKYATAAAFRTALDARFRAEADRIDVPVDRLRKLVVFDRLLARLLAVAPQRWVVKGGVALELRFGDRARTTKDLDLLREPGEDAAIDDLVAAQELDLGDFFVFVIDRPQRSTIVRNDVAVGFHVRVDLDGRIFDEVTIDVGIGGWLDLSPERIDGTGLLSFAQIEQILVPAIPLGRHVAEKLHAYTRTYGMGRPSSRPKDLIDLILICSTTTFLAGELGDDISAVFRARATHAIPLALPIPPAEWRSAFAVMASTVAIDSDVNGGHRLAAAFLDPVLGQTAMWGARWDVLNNSWVKPGG
ncbi:MAG: nucleotidyl transferase AbiEii/AbiGii toxin family protein [Thermomicrobiales bacterium]